MRRAPPLPPDRLRRLQELAQIRADAELARLAVTAQGRSRLLAALEALGRAEPPLAPSPAALPPTTLRPAALRPAALPIAGSSRIETPARPGTAAAGAGTLHEQPPGSPRPLALEPALVRARLAHAAWIEARRRELNARLAMVQADWLHLQPVAARAHARARVLGQLTETAEEAAERTRRNRSEGGAKDG